jgi:hypothetical protein
MNDVAKVFITCASWEDRFVLGCARRLTEFKFDRFIVFYFDAFSDWTMHSRDEVQKLCDMHRVKIEFVPLCSEDPSRSWTSQLIPVFSELKSRDEVMVDISTMPRETIWQTFWFLRLQSCVVKYVYNRPSSYGGWLSRDPDKPRLVFKLSGISRFGFRTALVVLAGYDVDRVRHLVETYEPEFTYLGLQKDSVDSENARRMKEQVDEFEGDNTVKRFWIDAYAPFHGYDEIRNELSNVQDTHNIIMASMGPKLSAVSLFKIHGGNDSFGLAYLPSREFNLDYSKGISESIFGSLPE